MVDGPLTNEPIVSAGMWREETIKAMGRKSGLVARGILAAALLLAASLSYAQDAAEPDAPDLRRHWHRACWDT